MDELLRQTHEAERGHFWYRGFRRFLEPLLVDASRGVGRPQLLDCGCGTGANLTILGQFGLAYGFDMAWAGIRYAAAAGHRRIAVATAARAPFPDSCFDVVTSFDVLYCLDDPTERRALQEMFRLLRPGGAAVINVPAMRLLRGNHSVFVHEQRRYSRTQLAAAVRRVGFRVERITHTNASLFVPMLMRRLAQRLRGLHDPGEAQSDFAQPPEPINAVLAGLLAVESFIVRHVDLPIGSSILCLARKPATE